MRVTQQEQNPTRAHYIFLGPSGARLDCGPMMERGVSAKVKTNSLLGWRELWHSEALLSRPR